MLVKHAVDAELSRLLGLTMKQIEPILTVGGDPAEKKFMECCWCLWKAGESNWWNHLSMRPSIFCLRSHVLYFSRG